MPRAKISLWAALCAGLIAIVVNTLLLHLADYIPLEIAHGGLLKLINQLVGGSVQATGLPSLWAGWGLPRVDSPGFKLGFHVFVGLLMAIFYVIAVEPAVPGPPWVKEWSMRFCCGWQMHLSSCHGSGKALPAAAIWVSGG